MLESDDSPIDAGETSPSQETSSNFKPSFLAQNEEELSPLQALPDTSKFKRQILRLHAAGSDSFSPEQLADRFLTLGDIADDEELSIEIVNPVLGRFNDEVRRKQEDDKKQRESERRGLEDSLRGMQDTMKKGQEEAAQREEERKKAQPAVDLAEKLDRLIELTALSNAQIIESFERQGATLEQSLREALDQRQLLSQEISGLPPLEQRNRFADDMLANELYERFQLGREPRFFQEMPTERRETYRAMLQIARAAYVKRVTSSKPEEYSNENNKDLVHLTNDQLRRLYEVPGVRQLLREYSNFVGDEFARCLSQEEFISLRQQARESVFLRLRGGIPGTTDDLVLTVQEKEADAIAWNFLYCGLQIESSNSRYGVVGERRTLPGEIASGEFQTIMHPQETFEAMASGGKSYGKMGEWANTQITRIKEEIRFNKKTEVLVFEPTNEVSKFWRTQRTGTRKPVVDDNHWSEKNVVIVHVPLCHPETTIGSVWEETKVKVNGERNEVSLFDLMRRGIDIPWGDIQDGLVGSWVTKVDKAYKLAEYFTKADKIKDPTAHAEVRSFSFGLNDLMITRLGLDKKSMDVNLIKEWAAIANMGGIRDVTNPRVKLMLPLAARLGLEFALKDTRNGLFPRGYRYRVF
jgi:hypothetical protein